MAFFLANEIISSKVNFSLTLDIYFFLVYSSKLDMTKKQLIDQVARKAHLPKNAAKECIEVFLDEIGRVLAKGNKVVLSGFGTFRVIQMKGKTVTIPNTDKQVKIKSHRSPRFTPGKKLKRQVTR